MLLKDDKQSDVTYALEGLDEDRKLFVQLVASVMLEHFDGGDWPKAKEIWKNAEFSTEECVACWSYFDSRQRAWLKDDDRQYLDQFRR